MEERLAQRQNAEGKEGCKEFFTIWERKRKKKTINTPKYTQQITKPQNRTEDELQEKIPRKISWHELQVFRGLPGRQTCWMGLYALPPLCKIVLILYREGGQASEGHTGNMMQLGHGPRPPDFIHGATSIASQMICSKLKAGERWSLELEGRTSEVPEGLQESPCLHRGTARD